VLDAARRKLSLAVSERKLGSSWAPWTASRSGKQSSSEALLVLSYNYMVLIEKLPGEGQASAGDVQCWPVLMAAGMRQRLVFQDHSTDSPQGVCFRRNRSSRKSTALTTSCTRTSTQ
jgi:hypothetical protein